ncbi:hypothetical protein [Mucilaginibacter paludis]|uniref:Uncharacterized protein n=1 Tax=Mucilaginibacter paludis DSM 18603 TaxID=714943 RepID=H1Y165_9SPHI|nr:hypothetical protein [Mucilaginibacter paludis]EHQ29700.1 hypothetical protein Mucpa_5631 [Mucilaginibacter paludis DSM 18603]
MEENDFIISTKPFIFRILRSEFYFWVVLGLLVSISPIMDIFQFGTREGISRIISINRYYILGSCIIILGAYMYKQIFEYYPLRSIRYGLIKRREYKRELHLINHSVPFTTENVKEIPVQTTPSETATEGLKTLVVAKTAESEDLRLKNIGESARIAEKLFSRSGIYLMIGCIIAFSGVFIFYNSGLAASDNTKTAPANIGQELLGLLPRFGSLFFIEFIAIFFLKQYRIVLEEYRYYELAKRRRQEDYDTFALIEKHQNNASLLEILKAKYSNSEQPNILKTGETTQIIEVQKLANQETEVFTKLIDLVKMVKEK